MIHLACKPPSPSDACPAWTRQRARLIPHVSLVSHLFFLPPNSAQPWTATMQVPRLLRAEGDDPSILPLRPAELLLPRVSAAALQWWDDPLQQAGCGRPCSTGWLWISPRRQRSSFYKATSGATRSWCSHLTFSHLLPRSAVKLPLSGCSDAAGGGTCAGRELCKAEARLLLLHKARRRCNRRRHCNREVSPGADVATHWSIASVAMELRRAALELLPHRRRCNGASSGCIAAFCPTVGAAMELHLG